MEGVAHIGGFVGDPRDQVLALIQAGGGAGKFLFLDVEQAAQGIDVLFQLWVHRTSRGLDTLHPIEEGPRVIAIAFDEARDALGGVALAELQQPRTLRIHIIEGAHVLNLFPGGLS